VAISLAWGQSSNKSLSEVEEGYESRQCGPQIGHKDNNSNASSVLLDDRTTSASINITKQCCSEACVGLTRCEACVGQIKINQMKKILFRTLCYIMQQRTQLISHPYSLFSISITKSRTRDIACDAEIIRSTPLLIHDLCDLSISSSLRTTSETVLLATSLIISFSFSVV
jgi:hypothetical protein